MKNLRLLSHCCAALLLLCAPVTNLAQAPADEKAAVAWLRQNAIPLKTVEAGSGFEDMEPLGNVVGDARIVALGEATHGTRDFFQLKHRMIEYLASRKGFTIFSIEANMPEAYRLNQYVLKGEGDPRQLLKGMYFWTWDTEEVLAMVEWMRDFNQSGKGHLEFTGFDMQTPALSLATVRDFLTAHDQSLYQRAVESPYDLVPLLLQQRAQTNFAVATAQLPGTAVSGKHVTVSGYMRSDDIADGYAGLWMRADGPNGVLGFKNLGERNVTGTTPWTRYEISLDVPPDAKALFFGATQSGTGTAWLDTMEVSIDGHPYSDPGVDFGFESDTPQGFHTGGEGYEVVLDKEVRQGGSQSLRMRRLSSNAPPDTKLQASALVSKCSEVVKELEKNRPQYLHAGVSAADVDWAIQSARLVLQFVELKAATRTRDASMADNVAWIAKQNPDAKIVLWAHNGHISSTGFSATQSMGSYLRKMYGSRMVNFGFAFNEGSFRAVEQGKGLHDFTVGPAPDDSLDHALAATGLPLFAVDLRRVPADGPAAGWFNEPHRSRSVGSMYSDAMAASLWSPGPTKADFDVLLFVEKTTAAHGNK